MSDELMEETQVNPEMEVSADDIQEQTPNVEKVTPSEKTEGPEQYTEREKLYYHRMKEAENIAKKAREELAKTRKPVAEIDAILEVQEATKGLDAKEVAELRLRANALGIPLTDARKDEGFALWQRGYKEKVEKENPPVPSTTQGNARGEKSLKDLTLDERTKLFQDLGLVTKQTGPRPTRQ